ncbi:sensor domain-containing phosphodiesterase [Aestuariirhabdus haliotis]|uniref:sensor domain-containing phosphodiesterase n=1 Tax=Aestuariirhabdus haliotis TaxID=2918751 RepID=UPI0020BD6747|nr:EAL domain-containing protein [Aestuariirhabdus haliotis]MCL6420130.1 EAL domain-containing protein [Aestuariirhabdus haliotis]
MVYVANFYIVLLDADNQTVRFAYYKDEVDELQLEELQPIPLEKFEKTLSGQLFMQSKTVFLSRINIEELAASGKITFVGELCHQWLGLPLITQNTCLGGLVVQSYSEDQEFSQQDIDLLEYVSQHVASATSRRQAQDKLKKVNLELEQRVAQRTHELTMANSSLQAEVEERRKAEQIQSVLFRISEQANKDQNIRSFYHFLHKSINELVEAPNFFIALLDDKREKVIFEYRIEDDEDMVMELAFDANKPSEKCSPTETILITGKTLLLDSKSIDENGKQHFIVGRRAVAWLGVPLIKGNQVEGAMVVQTFEPGYQYDQKSKELLNFVSQHVTNALYSQRNRIALNEAHKKLQAINNELEIRVDERTRDLQLLLKERQEIQDKLSHDALHDALTGLPNRNLFVDRVDHLLQKQSRSMSKGFSVMFLDLDRFKSINDSLGHIVGDELLIKVANRLDICLRPGDTVARLGGDEFCILLPDLCDEGSIQQVGERILQAVRMPFLIMDKEIYTSTSIGVTQSSIGYSNTSDVIRDADAAMYQAKSQGKNRLALFNREMHESTLRYIHLENSLRNAINNDEICVHYQPIVDLESGTILGYEALARWHHAELGMIGPQEFIAIAEEIGFIHDLGLYILESTLIEQKDNFAKGITVNVNLSARQFERDSLVDDILGLCQKHKVRPDSINFEITEGLLIANFDLAKNMLSKLRSAGFAIMLDDFGTGYSSLSYIHKLPIDTLKVDRSFMMGDYQQQAPLITTIVTLAEQMDLDVVAEGIESEQHQSFLRSLNVKKGQGYFFGRPAPVSG